MCLDCKYLTFWFNVKRDVEPARFTEVNGSDWVSALVVAPPAHVISVSLMVGYVGQG